MTNMNPIPLLIVDALTVIVAYGQTSLYFVYLLAVVLITVILAYFQYRILFVSDSSDNTETSSSITPWESRVTTFTPLIIGILLLSAGITMWVQPELVPPELVTQVEEIGDAPESPFILLGGLIGAVALAIITFGSRPSTQQMLRDFTPPETVEHSTQNLTGQHMDDLVESLSTGEGSRTADDRAAMKTYLREIIIESLVTHRGWSRGQAVEQVESGLWTSTTNVAAFIGGDEAPDMPLWWRLRDWLSADEPFERRIHRTVAELDRMTARGDDE